MKTVTEFLKRVVGTQGTISVNQGVATFDDGTCFNLGASIDPYWGPTLERFPMCNAGSNLHNYTIEAAKSGDYVRDSGAAIYSEVRVNIFAGDTEKCVADILVGLTETGEPRVLVSAAGNVDDLPISVYPLRGIDAAVGKSHAENDGGQILAPAKMEAINLDISEPSNYETGSALPTYLAVEAHCLDEETTAHFRTKFGVVVWERNQEPWCVVFQGPRAGLIEMYKEAWGEEEEPLEQWLSNIPPVNSTVRRAKSQILVDVLAQLVRPDTASFSELDDQRDANCYGDLCEDYMADALIAHFGGRDRFEGMPDGMIRYINDVQNEIDTWLRAGGVPIAISLSKERV